MADSVSTPTDREPPSDRRWEMTACALFVAVCLGCWLAHDPLRVMNDAAQAISVGGNILDGNGIRTGIIFYEEQYAPGEVPAPQTVFPPGYPALIALVAASGLPVATAAYVVVSVSFAAAAVLILLIARRMNMTFVVALFAALCWCGCVQCWDFTRGMMSELPFIALTLMSLLLFPPAIPRSRGLLFLSGCAAAAAFTMRYAGVFWFITVAAHSVVSLRQRFGTNLRATRTWGSVPMLTLGGLFWRNRQYSGEWTGGNAVGGQRSLSFTLREMYYSLSQLVGWAKSQLMAGEPAELLVLLSVTAGAVWLAMNRRQLRVHRLRLTSAVGDPRLLLCAGYAVMTIVMLIILDSRTPIGLGPRKVLPMLPFMLLGLGTVAPIVTISGESARRQLRVPGGLLMLALIFGQINVGRYVNEKPLVSTMVRTALETPIDAQAMTLQSFLQQEINNDAPLLTNEPHQVHLFLNTPVLGLPEPRYTDRRWTAAEVHSIVAAYGVQYVTLFQEPLGVAPFRAPFFGSLADGKVPDWLTPLHDDGKVLLFGVVSADHQQAEPTNPHEAAAVSRTTLHKEGIKN